MTKISTEKFWAILEKNDGNFHATARDIREEIGAKYSPAAAEDRAKKDPERLKKIESSITNYAKSKMRQLMDSENENIQFNSCKFWLQTKGGFTEKQELKVQGGSIPIKAWIQEQLDEEGDI